MEATSTAARGPRAIAARIASPGWMALSSSTSLRRMLSLMRNMSAGHSASGFSAWIRSIIWSMRSSVMRGIAHPFTSRPGPWSHRPVQDVVSMLTRPSSDTLPRSNHSFWHMWSSSFMLPCMRSVMLSENSTR